MDIVLLGIQGSGKGTQSAFLQERYGLTYFETGRELRRLSGEKSELGKKVKSIIEMGHLVPSEAVMDIIQDFIAHLPQKSNILFDGIPRKKDQARSFEELLKKSGRDFRCVLIALSKEEAMKRLTSRRICAKCKTVFPANFEGAKCAKCGAVLITRSDDHPEAIQNRLDAFFNETLPVIDEYRAKNLLIEIDGTPPIKNVTEELFKKLDPLFSNA